MCYFVCYVYVACYKVRSGEDWDKGSWNAEFEYDLNLRRMEAGKQELEGEEAKDAEKKLLANS